MIPQRAPIAKLVEELRANGHAKVTGFGAFKLVDVPARPGVNPLTGEPIELRPQRRVSFRPLPSFRKLIGARPE